MRSLLSCILLVSALLFFGCVQSDVPVLSESEIERGQLLSPGVYLCKSCEDALAVGWNEEAMLNTLGGDPIMFRRIGSKRLVQIPLRDGYMLFWATVEDGVRFTVYDLVGSVAQAVQERYGVDVVYPLEL